MIKEINMPMMTPLGGGSSAESTVAWEDIPAAGPVDIQSGRNVYIEFNEEMTATKASAGKILQFIKEGYMPVFKVVTAGITDWLACDRFSANNAGEATIEYSFVVFYNQLDIPLFAYSDALDKPFTITPRNPGPNSGSGQIIN